MAHPMHGEVKSSKEAKLRRLSGSHGTVDNPSGNKNAPSTYKNGPMKAVTLGAEGTPVQKNLGRYARGGSVKGKGTNVNIIIQPGGNQAPANPMGSIMPPPRPPMAPPAPPPMMPPGGAPGGAPGMPPGLPPGMMRKAGGRVDKSDMKQDKKTAAAAVHKHEKHLHKGEKETKLKSGGAVFTGGAGSGIGREEKAAHAKRK